MTWDTVGDNCWAECPHCGKMMDMSEVDPPEVGDEGQCEWCDGWWLIVDVETSVTVSLKKAKP